MKDTLAKKELTDGRWISIAIGASLVLQMTAIHYYTIPGALRQTMASMGNLHRVDDEMKELVFDWLPVDAILARKPEHLTQAKAIVEYYFKHYEEIVESLIENDRFILSPLELALFVQHLSTGTGVNLWRVPDTAPEAIPDAIIVLRMARRNNSWNDTSEYNKAYRELIKGVQLVDHLDKFNGIEVDTAIFLDGDTELLAVLEAGYRNDYVLNTLPARIKQAWKEKFTVVDHYTNMLWKPQL